MYEDALEGAKSDLEAAYDVDEEDEEPGDREDILADADYLKLFGYISEDRRIERVKSVLCEDAFPEMKMDCINGKCEECGFKKLWSQGLRQKLVDDGGDLHPNVNPIWMKEQT